MKMEFDRIVGVFSLRENRFVLFCFFSFFLPVFSQLFFRLDVGFLVV